MSNIFDMGGKPKENINIQNQIYEIKSLLPLVLEIAKLKSQYQRERYVELKREGFTDEQALEIIKTEKTPYDS